jgi:hypothetical protein
VMVNSSTTSSQSVGAMASPSGLVAQVSQAVRRGLGDGLKPRLVFLSIGMTLAAGVFWLIVFSVFHGPVWHAAEVAAQWFFQGAATSQGPEVAASTGWWASLWHSVAQGLSTFVAFLIALAAFALLVMLTLQILLEVFLMPTVQRQCLKRYPDLPTDVAGSLRANLMTSLRLMLVLVAGLALWIVPVLGGLAYFALAAYVMVRSLVNDALDGVASLEERKLLIRQHRGAMLGIGLLMNLLLVIPVAGLIVPSVLGASVCHLFMPALLDLRLQAALTAQADTAGA